MATEISTQVLSYRSSNKWASGDVPYKSIDRNKIKKVNHEGNESFQFVRSFKEVRLTLNSYLGLDLKACDSALDRTRQHKLIDVHKLNPNMDHL